MDQCCIDDARKLGASVHIRRDERAERLDSTR